MKYVAHFGVLIAFTFLSACGSPPTPDYESWKTANPYGNLKPAALVAAKNSSPIATTTPMISSTAKSLGAVPVTTSESVASDATAPHASVSPSKHPIALPVPSEFSEYSQVFINVCLQHAPALNEGNISRSVAQEKFNARNTLAGASVGVRNGKSCNLRIGGGGTRFAPPSDEEVQRLAFWYAQRIGGEVRRKRSAIDGDVWYEVRSAQAKYSVEASATRGVLSYWVSRR